MALSNLVVEQTYACNNSVVTFAIPFDFIHWQAPYNQIKVYLIDRLNDDVETLLPRGVGPGTYVITPDDPDIPPTHITTNDIYSGHYNIRIERDTGLNQILDLVNNGATFNTNVEQTLDRIVMTLQELGRRVDRSVKVSRIDQLEGVVNVTMGESNSDSVLTWNPDGTKIIAGPTVTELLAGATSANASAIAAAASAASASGANTSALNAAASAATALTYANQAAASAALLGPVVVGTRAAPQAISAAVGIAFNSAGALLTTWFIEGSGGAVSIIANPKIAAGTVVGQRLDLIVPSTAVNAVTINDATGVDLNGSWVGDPGRSLSLKWDGTTWFETARR